MKYRKASLILVLCISLISVGCSTAWVSTLDTILAVAAPALINILNIAAIAKGVPVDTALSAKITGDAATVKSLAADFSTASAAASPKVCSQLQAGISTYSQDIGQVMSLAQVSDSATQEKIAVLSGLVTGTVSAVLAVIPNCAVAQAAKLERFKVSPPIPLKNFVETYNAKLVEPTGNAAVDAWTKKHQVHAHSKTTRAVSLGYLQ